MSCEFSSERELPLKDRPFVGGELSTDLILLQKGGSIDHIVDKERVLQTRVIKGTNTDSIKGFRLNSWKTVLRKSNC